MFQLLGWDDRLKSRDLRQTLRGAVALAVALLAQQLLALEFQQPRPLVRLVLALRLLRQEQQLQSLLVLQEPSLPQLSWLELS